MHQHRERGDGMAQDLKILQKIFDMMEYGYLALAQFPKSEKFALVTDIKRSMDTLLERCIEAQKRYYKKSTLQDMDVEIMKLRAYVRLSFQLGFLPPKKYEIWSEKLVEIGKMLGGWIKAVKGSNAFLLRWQLEQLFLWAGVLQRQQRPLQLQHEHRLPLRFTAPPDAAHLPGTPPEQRCVKGSVPLVRNGLKISAAKTGVPASRKHGACYVRPSGDGRNGKAHPCIRTLCYVR